jgi:hypothetical protein
MITEDQVRTITEEQLKKFNLVCNPEVTKVNKGRRGWIIRVMWGFENEGIEFTILEDMPERIFGDAVYSKIKKELNGIRAYSRLLYSKIMGGPPEDPLTRAKQFTTLLD